MRHAVPEGNCNIGILLNVAYNVLKLRLIIIIVNLHTVYEHLINLILKLLFLTINLGGVCIAGESEFTDSIFTFIIRLNTRNLIIMVSLNRGCALKVTARTVIAYLTVRAGKGGNIQVNRNCNKLVKLNFYIIASVTVLIRLTELIPTFAEHALKVIVTQNCGLIKVLAFYNKQLIIIRRNFTLIIAFLAFFADSYGRLGRVCLNLIARRRLNAEVEIVSVITEAFTC